MIVIEEPRVAPSFSTLFLLWLILVWHFLFSFETLIACLWLYILVCNFLFRLWLCILVCSVFLVHPLYKLGDSCWGTMGITIISNFMFSLAHSCLAPFVTLHSHLKLSFLVLDFLFSFVTLYSRLRLYIIVCNVLFLF